MATFKMPQVFVAPKAPTGHNALSGLQRTLPPVVDETATFLPPTFNADGTIQYEKSIYEPATQPDEINGYRRDDGNPWLFHPLWPPCAARFYGTTRKPNGCIDVMMACNHPEASTYRTNVDSGTCHGCVLRTDKEPPQPDPKCPRPQSRDFKQPIIQPDGRLVYEKTGWEPPVCPEGYDRDPDDQWVFVPKWLPCVDRTFDNAVRPCGCVTINAQCNSPTSGYAGKTVPFEGCQVCPVRRVTKEPETYSIG